MLTRAVSNFKFQISVFSFLFFFSGTDAQNYFQQEVNYTIHVSLNDKKHELNADLSIDYTNNSPTTLREIYFHLWPNGYKNENSALEEQLFKQGENRFIDAGEKDFGYISDINFKVNGSVSDWNMLEDTSDICVIQLKNPLKSGEKISISTPFRVKIPSGKMSRFGHLGQSYQITQWYPKPAVYDRNGWNYFSYLDQGEYYSEFGTFDVFITLPANYVVGATGDLVDGEKELKWLDENVKATQSMNPFSTDMSFQKSADSTKTLHYHQERVHDFAWFADKRWHVLKGEIELPQSKRKITAWAMFTNAEAEYWKKSIGYITDATKYYSQWVGDYPYNNVSAVDVTESSGNGMEYPTITAIGNYGSEFDLDITIAHEVGHNWFYGILGSNERAHPWMDEGMNQFCETRYVYTKFANDSAKQMDQTDRLGFAGKVFGINKMNHRQLEYTAYLIGARSNTDQPPDLSSEKFSQFNYGVDVYRKTALSFDYLKSYLGDSLFDLCMHHYFDEWKFKHPMPQDVKNVFEKTSGKKLDWIFDDLLFTSKKIDYKISSVENQGKNISADVINVGRVNSPVSLSAMKDGKVLTTKWFDGFAGEQTLYVPCNDCDALRIDGEEKIPEVNRKNNSSRARGILRRMEPFKFQWLAKFEDPHHTQIFFTPVLGRNEYNSLMPGMVLHNFSLPEKKFEYLFMPMYSVNGKNLAGGGRLSYNIKPFSDYFDKINLSVGANTYAYQDYKSPDESFSYLFYYRKISPSLTFSLINRRQNVDNYNYITLRNVFTQTEELKFKKPDTVYVPYVKNVDRIFNFLIYTFGNSKMLNPNEFNFTVGGTNQFVLASVQYEQTFSYSEKGKGLDFRFYGGFAGSLEDEKNPVSNPVDFRLRMSGQTGSEDYLYDEVFEGRNEGKGISSQQFMPTQGGFKVASYASSETWLLALNLKTVLPGILPVKFFADIGAYDVPKGLSKDFFKPIMYDFGIELILVPKICSVYFPFSYSADIKETYKANTQFAKYSQRIRFELNLSKLNPFELRKNNRF
jgi:hypothetical protein